MKGSLSLHASGAATCRHTEPPTALQPPRGTGSNILNPEGPRGLAVHMTKLSGQRCAAGMPDDDSTIYPSMPDGLFRPHESPPSPRL